MRGDAHIPLELLNEALAFPDPRAARADGLVAIGGDLSVPRLLLAYRSGIFPWTADPLSWWSPDPRAVFELNQFRLSRSLGKVIRQQKFQITIDRAFRQVIEGCAAAAPGRRSTWITPAFIQAYTALHDQGHAHSLECWLGEELAGGIYGVAIGGLFAGESMFHRADDASKVALYHLTRHLLERGFVLLDIQMLTPITQRLGGITIPRAQYLDRLTAAVQMNCTFAGV